MSILNFIEKHKNKFKKKKNDAFVLTPIMTFILTQKCET